MYLITMHFARLPRRSPAALIVLLAGLWAGGLWGGLPGPAAAQLSPEQAARVDSVFADLNRTDGPGCALGVVRDGEMIYAHGYGMANLDHGVALGPESIFRLASVSKQFTAASAVLAARQGHFALDDPVSEHVSELPVWADSVTVRQLLHHTSGIRDYLALYSLAGRSGALTPAEIIDLLARQQDTNFPPGTKHLYSNSGYFLISVIIRRATGRSLRAFAREELFEPLGMKNTHYHDDYTEVVPNRATGYAPREDGGYRISTTRWENLGDGSVFSSVSDLVHWIRNFSEPRVGGEALVDALLSRGTLANGDTIDYALGLTHGTHHGLHAVAHGGAFVGYRNYITLYPEEQVSVMCLCNSASVAPGALSRSVAEVVLADRMKPEPDARRDTSDQVASDTEMSPEELEPYAGPYRTSWGGYVRVRVEEGRLVTEDFGQRVPLRAIASDRFSAANFTEWAFDREGTSRAEQVTVHFHGRATTFDRVELAAYSEAERQAFTGRYHSEELGVDYRISADGDTLTLEQGDRDPKVLRPGIEDEFSFGGGEGTVEFARNEAGEVTGFEVHTGRARGIRFVRRP